MAICIQIRRDTAANWVEYNPVLLSGEFGYDETNYIVKIGDGTKPWNDLPALCVPCYGPSSSSSSRSSSSIVSSSSTVSSSSIVSSADSSSSSQDVSSSSSATDSSSSSQDVSSSSSATDSSSSSQDVSSSSSATDSSSSTSSATPPGAPTNLMATAGDAQVSLSWTAPADDGGFEITSYSVEYSDDAGSTWTPAV